jgi:patatin-like phospholipase/acyl hydrolase
MKLKGAEKMAKEFRILSIDGGGMLGTYSAAILDAIEKHYKKPILGNFDLISGTSSGSIIAAALAVKKTPAEILGFFTGNARRVFNYNRAGTAGDFFRTIWQLIGGSKYSNKRLLEAYRALYGENTSMGSVKTCYLCLTSFNVTRGRTTVFRTPHSRGALKHIDVPLWKAVACSSAAMTYMPQYFMDNYGENCGYVDGGSWANNPTMVGLAETFKNFMDKNNNIKIKVVSVGSYSENLRSKRVYSSLASWGTDLLTLFFSGQVKSADYELKCILNDSRHDYVRFEPVVDHSQAKKFTMDNTDPGELLDMIDMAGADFTAHMKEKNFRSVMDSIFLSGQKSAPKFLRPSVK